jgi:prevent-host-death family protein
MKPAKVSELKAGLSKYLARVKRGEEVVVTERGRAIAKLVPIPPDEDPEMERMRDLERRGIVTIHGAGRIPPDFWDLPRLDDPDGLVLKALLEEREEGR